MSDGRKKTVYGYFGNSLESRRLEELCEPKIGIQTGPFGSQLHQADYVSVGTPIITVEHLGENRILHLDLPRVTEADRVRLSKYSLREGDIVFSRVGSVDRRALVRKAEVGWLFSGRCLRVRPNQNLIYPGYLSHFFGLPTFKEYIRTIAVGATMPSINTEILSNVDIYYPPKVSEQKIITRVLDSLEDKIELNSEINQTLEEIAQATFKSWFVDFDPVKAKIVAKSEGRDPLRAAMCAISGKSELELDQLSHEQYESLSETAALFPDKMEDSELGRIPAGWAVKNINDVLERLSVGKKYEQKTALPEGSIPILDQGKSGVIGYHNEAAGVLASVDKPVIVFANHTCYMRLVSFPFSAIQNVLPFVGKNISTLWLYYATLGKQKFSEYKGHWPDFVIQKIVVPMTNMTFDFSNQIKEMIKLIWSKESEANLLAGLRDTLLPKLLSGELPVEHLINKETE